MISLSLSLCLSFIAMIFRLLHNLMVGVVRWLLQRVRSHCAVCQCWSALQCLLCVWHNLGCCTPTFCLSKAQSQHGDTTKTAQQKAAGLGFYPVGPSIRCLTGPEWDWAGRKQTGHIPFPLSVNMSAQTYAPFWSLLAQHRLCPETDLGPFVEKARVQTYWAMSDHGLHY